MFSSYVFRFHCLVSLSVAPLISSIPMSPPCQSPCESYSRYRFHALRNRGIGVLAITDLYNSLPRSLRFYLPILCYCNFLLFQLFPIAFRAFFYMPSFLSRIPLYSVFWVPRADIPWYKSNLDLCERVPTLWVSI